MLLRRKGSGEGFKGAPGSIRDPVLENSSKGMVERSCVVGLKPHWACDT